MVNNNQLNIHESSKTALARLYLYRCRYIE
nr:MAG TPA: hypothetical protein [Caudoviricetes sp.]